MKERAEAPQPREAAVINPGILQIPPATRQALLSLHFVLTPEPSRDLSITILVLLGEKGRSDDPTPRIGTLTSCGELLL